MTLSASDIKVGKCYITGRSKMRRVLEVSEFEVKYERIGRSEEEVGEPWIAVSREKFAAEVDREIGCPE